MNSDIDCVIDGSSLYARAYFAAQRAGADPIAAGVRSFLGVINHTRCTRAIFCWDGKPKSNKPREEKPEDYDRLQHTFRDKVEWLWGCPQIRSSLHEADDLVAALVYSDFVAGEVFVVSGDKDLQQLINCRKDYEVKYYCLNTKTVLDPLMVVEKWSVKRPSHIAIALAILGDRGDGVSGIKGWGPAKVAKLFESVTPEMNFEQAVLAIDEQVPDHLKQTFYDCLEATILHQDVDLTEGPGTLNWRHPEELSDANLGDVRDQYATLYYARKPISDNLDDLI